MKVEQRSSPPPCPCLPYEWLNPVMWYLIWNFFFPKISVVLIFFWYNLVCLSPNFWRCEVGKNQFCNRMKEEMEGFDRFQFQTYLLQIPSCFQHHLNKFISFIFILSLIFVWRPRIYIQAYLPNKYAAGLIFQFDLSALHPTINGNRNALHQ